MMGHLSAGVAAAKRQVAADLREDPYLAPILAGTLVLAGFWFWHRIPNFATWDERDRLLDPLVAYGSVLSDPGIEGLREGVAWGREPFGATFYLYALAVLPVVLVALLAGNADAITAIGFPKETFGYHAAWQRTPEWVWTASLVAARLLSVAFAVGSVYLTYRLGTALRDRTVGRVAALVLALSFGFLMLAHEAGEDVPALFFLLLAVYLLVRYVQTGERGPFLWASAAGGVAIAFKLTAAPVVLLAALAFALRARTAEGRWLAVRERPRLLAAGAALGAVVVLLGFPTLLVGRLDLVVERFTTHAATRTVVTIGPEAPVWWWFLRGYSHAFGLPLLLAATAGVLASLASLRHEWPERPGTVLVVAGLGLYLLLYAGWHDFRVHHLLPTLPLIALLFAGAAGRVHDRRPRVARPALALVLILTAVYAGVGTAQYASLPRDEATEWLDDHAPANATMEVYQYGFEEVAAPHGMAVYTLADQEVDASQQCPRYIQVVYQDLLYLRQVPAEARSGYITERVDERAAYLRALLAGEYNYDIVAEFGPRPPGFRPQRPTPGSLRDALAVGLDPHTDQYGDEQDLTSDQYVVILERTGACDESRAPPW